MTAWSTWSTWSAYNTAQDGRQVRELCREAMRLAGPGAGRTALDLGCGLGLETRALLLDGWRVQAIDGLPESREMVLRTTADAGRERLEVRTAAFGELTGLPPAELVHAGCSLPFAGADFDRVWELVRTALRPGGWLAVNLFGDRDSWAAEHSDCRFLRRDQAERLLDGLSVHRFHEHDADGSSFDGPKHWHRYDILARA